MAVADTAHPKGNFTQTHASPQQRGRPGEGFPTSCPEDNPEAIARAKTESSTVTGKLFFSQDPTPKVIFRTKATLHVSHST